MEKGKREKMLALQQKGVSMIMTHLRSTHLCARMPDLSISASVQKVIPSRRNKRSHH